MNRSAAGVLCFMIMSLTSLVAGGPGQGKSQKSDAPTARAVSRETTAPREAAASREPVRQETSIHFSVDQVRVIKSYYAPRKSQLYRPDSRRSPARTGQLPPGWQKKMEPLPATIERDLHGCRTVSPGVIDGHAVVYSSRAGTIIDVAVLF